MSGSSPTTTKEVFNVSTPAGAVALLRRVHVAALPAEVKNQLRDAVFALQNSTLTTDQAAAQELFAAHGIEIELRDGDTAAATEQATTSAAPNAVESVSERKSAFGRPAPQFAVPPLTSKPASPATPEEPEEASEPKEADAATTTTTTSTTPAADEEEGAATDVAEKVPIKKAVDEAAAELPTSDKKSDDPVERIKEIKRTVNGLVGNPVNLIDVDNAVGREYMNALLDAMKKVNTGVAASDMERAMNRLEEAFAAAQTALSKQSTSAAASPDEATVPPATADTATAAATSPAPSSPPSEPAPMEDQLQAQSAQEPPQSEQPVPNEEPATNDAAVTKIPVAPEPKTTAPATEAPAATPNTSPVEQPQSATTVPTTSTQKPMSSVGARAETTQANPQTSTTPPEPDPTTAAASSGAEESSRFTAVAKEKQLKQLMQEQDETLAQQKTEQEMKDAANPLMAPDVTTGLEQLLSEWKLFKSSGIFGTGPSGIDHPLYKKLAPLTMAAIMTGRFEGASPEIKQNITEYMSGWRYEEGIVYEPGETFEHYLRRVIRHILDERKEGKVDKSA